MIIDACHSGSFHKGFSTGYTVKGIKRSRKFHNDRRDFFTQKHKKRVENLVVLSASKDNELSIDTPKNGGLFTDTIYRVWDKNPNISFRNLTYKTAQIIKGKNFNNLKPQQPQLNSTNNQENTSVNLYLQDVEGYLDMAVRKSHNNPIFITSARPHYSVGSPIYFKINTRHKKGYFYIINVGERKIERIFPNRYYKSSKILNDKFRFPSKRFEIKATISNQHQQQRTVAYAILSNSPIVQLENNSRLSFAILKDIFGDPSQSGWLSGIFSSNISLGKSDFWVYR